MTEVAKGNIVTLGGTNLASNTFLVDTVEDQTLLLTHPLACGLLMRVPKEVINTVGANIKDSTEKCIDYANGNRTYLDFNTIGDLEAVSIYFAIKRQITPKQKQTLANICGTIARIRFNNDIKEAMLLITKNNSILDDFNSMWYHNFRSLFSGKKPITSPLQVKSIFNMAGYVLAELENPNARSGK